MRNPFEITSITVNGHEVVLDNNIDLRVGDLSGDMDRIASQMGYWASVWASAVKENILVKSRYRNWRSKIVVAILNDNPKLSEWKVKARIESLDLFLEFKNAMAIAEKNVVFSKAIFESFEKKSNQLQSKGAMSRSELDSTNLHTPMKKVKKTTRVKPKISEEKEDFRVTEMKEIFNLAKKGK